MRKTIGLVIVLAFLASACETPGPGESATVTCSTGQAGWFGLDNNGIAVTCGGTYKDAITCPDGTHPDVVATLSAVTVTCVQIVDPATLGEGDITFDQQVEEDLSPAAISYCSGGRAWGSQASLTDYVGREPTRNGTNWRVGYYVTWCVKNGVVATGLKVQPWDQIVRPLFYTEGPDCSTEIAKCVSASPAYTDTRRVLIDWDLGFGRCPWCFDIDVDANFTVDSQNPAHMKGYLRHNADGV